MKTIYSLLFFCFGVVFFIQAQIPILNRSFEAATLGGRPPEPWLFSSSPDHLPGNWRVNFRAREGRFYVGMVVRSNGSKESTYQAVSVPPNQDLNLYFWLASTSDDYGGSGRGSAKLNVWLSEDFPLHSGSYQKLIYQSEPSQQDNWELQIVNFSVEQPTNYLILESEFLESGNFQRGNILVDYLSSIRDGEIVMDLDLILLCAKEIL